MDITTLGSLATRGPSTEDISGRGLVRCKPLPETHFAKRRSLLAILAAIRPRHRLKLLPFQHSEQEI
jgi:hypothetical protein